VTLHNCLAAADELGRDGIRARVLDLYSVKPIDTEALLAAADATGNRLVVAEDHYPAGGIGSAVLEAFNDAGHPAQIAHLAVRGLPGSGTLRSSWRQRGSPSSYRAGRPRSPRGCPPSCPCQTASCPCHPVAPGQVKRAGGASPMATYRWSTETTSRS
jgi:hypothetical protein